jgi:hypothetical protein
MAGTTGILVSTAATECRCSNDYHKILNTDVKIKQNGTFSLH